MRIYIAGPYTKGDPVVNTRKAIAAAEMVRAWGDTPIVPHLTMLWHTVSPQEWEYWLKYDLELLSCCDALLRLPGESTGADREVAYAKAHDIPVYDHQNVPPMCNQDAKLQALLEDFEQFSRLCRRRLVVGQKIYGDAWETRDNRAEIEPEAGDAHVYGFLDWLQAKGKGCGGAGSK